MTLNHPESKVVGQTKSKALRSDFQVKDLSSMSSCIKGLLCKTDYPVHVVQHRSEAVFWGRTQLVLYHSLSIEKTLKLLKQAITFGAHSLSKAVEVVRVFRTHARVDKSHPQP